MTTAQQIIDIFTAHADGTADFARVEGFSGTPFEAAAASAFADDKMASGEYGNWSFGVVHINKVAEKVGGTVKYDADGTRHFVFADGSALRETEAKSGVFFYPVAKWVRNEDTSKAD